MFLAILKGQWWFISDFSYMMTKIAVAMFIIAFAGCCIVMVWSALQRPLSRFMKVKEAYVEVLYVPKDVLDRSAIAVRFLDPKKRGRKGFLMKADDIQVGDKGTLRYQGVYGLEFNLDVKIVQKDYHQRFGFFKKKKEDAAVKPEQRTHHKRKYW